MPTDIVQQETSMQKQRKKSRFKSAEVRPEAEAAFNDPAEPVIRFYHHFHIFKVIGWLWIVILLGLVFAATAGVIPMLFQFLIGDLVDSLASSKDSRAAVNDISLKLLIIAIGAGAAQFLSQFVMNLASELLAGKLKQAYFTAVTSQEIGYFDMKKTGQLTSYLSNDIQKIQAAYTIKIAAVVQNFSQIVIGIVLSFRATWKLTLVNMAAIPVVALLMAIAGTFMQIMGEKISEANGTGSSTATEVFGSMRIVRSMAGEEKERVKFAQSVRRANLLGIGNAFAQGCGLGLIEVLTWASCALCFWYGGILIAQNEISIGDLFKAFGLMIFANFGFTLMIAQFPDIAKGMSATTSLLKVMLRQPQIRFKGGETPSSVEGNISFTDVDFAYPTRPNIQVLKKFSLDIKQGKQVALVGGSGSGKSTILGLVERFYEPSSGVVALDGIDIKKLDPQWLHRQIAIVTQEPTLFNTTIRKNITYAVGDSEVTEEQVIAAAKAANCHAFIDELPDKYNTVVGERGTSLSGGQKQRIAIARAILQNPKILLLDEATSALDTESEKLVQDALNHLMSGRTSIIIAHRLATVKNADELIVMQHGEIVERGSHFELLKKPNGAYTKLAQKQMIGSNDEKPESGVTYTTIEQPELPAEENISIVIQ